MIIMDKRIKEIDIYRNKEGLRSDLHDYLVVEAPVTIYLNEEEMVTLLCTPENLEELAVGFLVSEGFIRNKEELQEVKADYDKGNVFVVTTGTSLIAERTFLKRYITTGCGKGTSFYNVMDAKLSKIVDSGLKISAEAILALMKEAANKSELFLKTGGVHSTALCDTKEIIVFREDIGRHNATDKIVGKCFREGIPLQDKILFTTGRISSEILIKVAKMGISIIVSRSAPTALAIDIAKETGVTVIGFVRGSRFNIYTSPERVV